MSERKLFRFIGSFKPALILLFLVCLLSVFLHRWGNDGWKEVISSDGKGYYAYLPALFIDHNLGRQDVNQEHINVTPGGTCIKYPAGVALLLSPFFGIGWLLAVVTGLPADGFSEPFQKMVSIAALFYLLAGLYCLSRLLKSTGRSAFGTAVAVVAIVLATNLYYYAVLSPSMSHVYSFSIISCFLWSLYRFSVTFSPRHFYLTALFFGLMILIRPVNGLVILILPFFFSSWKDFLRSARTLLSYPYRLLSAAGILAMLLAIQAALWWYQTGKLLVWSYAGEGFYFGNPQLFRFLLGFRKGLFIYTPLLLLALFGLIPLWKKSRPGFISLLLILLPAAWLTSSWWNWYYGDGFGMRAFIDYYPFFALLLALLYDSLRKAYAKIILAALVLFFLFLNQVQTFQYRKGILHPFNMDRGKYAYLFLKTGESYVNITGGCHEVPPYSRLAPDTLYSSIFTFDSQGGISKSQATIDEKYLQVPGRNCFVFDTNAFGPAFDIPASLFPDSAGRLFAEAELSFFQPAAFAASGCLVVVEARTGRNPAYYYRTFRISGLPDTTRNRWLYERYSFNLPRQQTNEDTLHIYLWNKERKRFFMDDVGIRVLGFH
jgi:hypothetical protein